MKRSTAAAGVLLAAFGFGWAVSSAKAETPEAYRLVAAFEEVLVNVVEHSRKAVVSISASEVRSPVVVRRILEREVVPFTTGSGFFVRPEGYIVTNDHVVHEAKSVSVGLEDGRKLTARIVGVDPNTDIAVLKIELPEPAPTLEWGDSEAARPGQFVLTVGNPLGLNYSANMGIISAKGRGSLLPEGRGSDLIRYQDFIQTDAYLNSGNSGGPLVNLKGEVIGINAMIRTGESNEFAGLGFAIPSKIAKVISDQLIEHGKVVRGYLGMRFEGNEDGVLVRQVLPGGAAEKSGLKNGDLITHAEGKRLTGHPVESIADQFKWTIANTYPGSTLKLTVIREGKPIPMNIVVGEMPARFMGLPEPAADPKRLAALGLKTKTLPTQIAENQGLSAEDEGVVILTAESQGLAFAHGLRTGDLILEVNGVPVTTPEACERAIDAALERNAETLSFLIKSGDESRKVEIPSHLLSERPAPSSE